MEWGKKSNKDYFIEHLYLLYVLEGVMRRGEGAKFDKEQTDF